MLIAGTFLIAPLMTPCPLPAVLSAQLTSTPRPHLQAPLLLTAGAVAALVFAPFAAPLLAPFKLGDPTIVKEEVSCCWSVLVILA